MTGLFDNTSGAERAVDCTLFARAGKEIIAFSHTIRLAPNPDPGHEIPPAMATAATLAQPARLHLECAAGGAGVDLRGTTLRAVRVGELSGGEVATG